MHGIPDNDQWSARPGKIFKKENIDGIFLPLLRRLNELHERLARRILVFLAAPPGAGKSTLAVFLQQLADSTPGLQPLTVIGMDGFHRRQEYLISHTIIRNGQEIRLVDIKGAPVTFDLDLLRTGIARAAAGEDCEWPAYDRLLHNPVYRGQKVTGNIVLLEGNYLLLDEEGWRELKHHADYTVRIWADPDLLRERLIRRKTDSGTTRDKAEAFVEFSDLQNARLCMAKTVKADLNLVLLPDDSYRLQNGKDL